MKGKFRLGLMMFLQYAIWGAWSPVLSEYLINDLGFSPFQMGVILGLLPLAIIISPFIGGQVADRYFASQKIVAFLQLSGGVLLAIVSTVTEYHTMMWLMLIYCLLYAPTLALTNSIAFINLKKSEKEFGYIRVWGTIGWIVAGLILMGWRFAAKSFDSLVFAGDTLLLAGFFSIIMGIQAFFLPHTPPKKEVERPWAFLEAIKMMKDKNFVVFVSIAFVVATELMFYYNLTAPFLTSEKIGLSDAAVPGVMVIAQVAEILVMVALLPYLISKIGIRNILVIGVLAWPVRYIIFAIGTPSWLVIASLSLHGFCFVFFFVAAFIYVDMVSPRDIRHSTQSLITVVTYGLGNLLGSLFAGAVLDYFTTETGSNWTAVFLVPCVLTVLCAFAFLLFFRPMKKPVPLEL
ncbi:MAG: MFS transporter [Candidatus Aminicenantes bacterium]|nr:MAG: MFS transporter [Candidatus Aminicenantes bacterium]